MTLELLREKLTSSNLLMSHHAVKALDDEQVKLIEGEGDSESLLRIYRIRLDHLRQFSSPHAQNLFHATSEFVANLEASQARRVYLVVIQLSGVQEYSIFFTETSRVVGCIPTISKLEVSEDKWHELWGVGL